eukprot:scaffold70017_cov68-Phaeocystis_antarctica.AAC.1
MIIYGLGTSSQSNGAVRSGSFERVAREAGAGEAGAEGKHLVLYSLFVHVLHLGLLSGPQLILLLAPQRADMLELVILWMVAVPVHEQRHAPLHGLVDVNYPRVPPLGCRAVVIARPDAREV